MIIWWCFTTLNITAKKEHSWNCLQIQTFLDTCPKSITHFTKTACLEPSKSTVSKTKLSGTFAQVVVFVPFRDIRMLLLPRSMQFSQVWTVISVGVSLKLPKMLTFGQKCEQIGQFPSRQYCLNTHTFFVFCEENNFVRNVRNS